MLDRVEAGYGPARRQALQQEIARYRQQTDGEAQVQGLLDRYRRRMYDISVFIKELKGRFAQWYNQRHDRYGVLWAERFKSVLLEGGEALAAVAAYIELNPVSLPDFQTGNLSSSGEPVNLPGSRSHSASRALISAATRSAIST